MKKKDVLVIGAGAAGLSCARELLKSGLDIAVLEARDRVGGRAFSQPLPHPHLPVELGCEFIHGNPKILMQLADSLKIPFYDVTDTHLLRDHGKLKPSDFWEKIDGMLKKIPKTGRDQSVQEFLSKIKNSAQEKSLFTAFVEGFHSADTSLMSEKGLAQAEQSGDDSLNGSGLFRLVHGYSDLMQRFADSIPGLSDALHFHTEVKRVEWNRGGVRVECKQGSASRVFEAKKLVVTIPHGVLKKPDAINWAPAIPELESALDGVEMGHVERIVFQFRSRCWEKLSKKPVSFLHGGAEDYFPTWWSYAPLRLPFLVAWQGGPKAKDMAENSEEWKIATALRTLAKLTAESEDFLRNELVGFHAHNWSTDPFSLGAYSYIAVGGMARAQRLQQPFGPILLAGEATVNGSARGTVHGAMESGVRAARQISSKVKP